MGGIPRQTQPSTQQSFGLATLPGEDNSNFPRRRVSDMEERFGKAAMDEPYPDDDATDAQ
jgi:hypothetical protein